MFIIQQAEHSHQILKHISSQCGVSHFIEDNNGWCLDLSLLLYCESIYVYVYVHIIIYTVIVHSNRLYMSLQYYYYTQNILLLTKQKQKWWYYYMCNVYKYNIV